MKRFLTSTGFAALALAAAQCAQATRQPEALERYKAETLSVFSISAPRCDGTRSAAVLDPDRHLHLVEEGSYLGDAYGRIDAITDEAVFFVELHQVGERWTEVRKSIRLPESKIAAQRAAQAQADTPPDAACHR